MDQPKFVQRLTLFLEQICLGNKVPVSEEIISEFGERCKDSLRSLLTSGEEKRKFTLRMSNIGKDIRQLWLEKTHGSPPVDPSFLLKMTYGNLTEHLLLALIKSSGTVVDDEDKKVSLTLPSSTVIEGTYDVKIEGEIWDFKSSSPYSYKYKFTSVDSVRGNDSFGYCGQGVGYALADNSAFGGWIVLDKSSGEFKAVSASNLNSPEVKQEYINQFETTVAVLNDDTLVPECSGVIEETFNRKSTGKYILNKSCEFCPHKYKCHPNLQYAPCAESEAKNQPWRYYVS